MFIYFLQDTLTRLYKFPDGNKSNKNAMNHIPTKLTADSRQPIFHFQLSVFNFKVTCSRDVTPVASKEFSVRVQCQSSVSEF